MMRRDTLMSISFLFALGCLDTAVDPRPGPPSDLDAEIFDVRAPINAPTSGSGSGYGSGYESGSGANARPDPTQANTEQDVGSVDFDFGVLEDAFVETDANTD